VALGLCVCLGRELIRVGLAGGPGHWLLGIQEDPVNPMVDLRRHETVRTRSQMHIVPGGSNFSPVSEKRHLKAVDPRARQLSPDTRDQKQQKGGGKDSPEQILLGVFTLFPRLGLIL
jgi:hypothetical protein